MSPGSRYLTTGRPAAPARQRMLVLHQGAQLLVQHMRVDLRGGDVGVAEHGLHAAQVRSALEQMGRETVPDHVRGQIVKNTRFPSQRRQQFPERLPGERPSARRDEQIRTRPPVEQLRPYVPQIPLNRRERRFPDRRNPLLVAFSDGAQDAGLDLDVGDA